MARKKAEAQEPAGDDAPAGGKRKVLIVSVAVVALAALGGGAMAGGLIGGGGAEAGPEASEAPTEEVAELGRLVQLESVTINLAEGRFLKLGVAVEVAADVAEDPQTAPIYDQVITLFSPMSYDQLRDAAVREQTKVTLLEGLHGVFGDQITGIYYTEFIMQ